MIVHNDTGSTPTDWMHTIRVNTLQWMVAGFCAIIGALMLVAPHQFASPAFTPLQPYLGWWGSVFLAVGAALSLVTGLALRGGLVTLARLSASGILLMLATCFWLVQGWTGVIVYGVMGAGMAIAAFLPAHFPPTTFPGSRFFGLLMALASLLNGLIILSIPEQFAGFFYETMRWHIVWNGLAFLVGGLALFRAYLEPRLSPPSSGSAICSVQRASGSGSQPMPSPSGSGRASPFMVALGWPLPPSPGSGHGSTAPSQQPCRCA